MWGTSPADCSRRTWIKGILGLGWPQLRSLQSLQWASGKGNGISQLSMVNLFLPRLSALNSWASRCRYFTLPETNSQFAPENGNPLDFLEIPNLEIPHFLGALAVSFRECIFVFRFCYKSLILQLNRGLFVSCHVIGFHVMFQVMTQPWPFDKSPFLGSDLYNLW